MVDQHRSIQTEDTKEGQKEIARKAEDAKRQIECPWRWKGFKRWRENGDLKRQNKRRRRHRNRGRKTEDVKRS